MRNVRKLLLLAAMALAAVGLSVPAAFGQVQENHETLEILDGQGNHCPAVNMATHSGGCLIHATSETNVELRKHVFGIESHITSCTHELWGRSNEDAEGWITSHNFIGGPSCVRQPCKVSGVSQEWPAHADEGHVVGVDGETGVPAGEWGTVTFCVEPVGGGTDESCEIDIPANQAGAGLAEFGQVTEMAGHGFSGFRCELIGHWNTEHGVGDDENEENLPGAESEDEITIVHLANEDKAETP